VAQIQVEPLMVAKPTYVEADASAIDANGAGGLWLGVTPSTLSQRLDHTSSAVGLCEGFAWADQNPSAWVGPLACYGRHLGCIWESIRAAIAHQGLCR
jgi:hypothetical protein